MQQTQIIVVDKISHDFNSIFSINVKIFKVVQNFPSYLRTSHEVDKKTSHNLIYF